ncbi:phosphate binding protein [Neokomagataea thailandica NBRC 106555]|nr:phosphate binding protein [Neokomagataea thailandica NBRC 106555]
MALSVAPAASRAEAVQPDARHQVSIVGNDGLQKVLEAMMPLVKGAHSSAQYRFVLKGSSTGLPALAAGVALFAPITREARHAEISGFKQAKGYEPVAVKVGYAGWGPRQNGKTPTAVYVARSNALEAISINDLGRVFSAGSPLGDFNVWGQLGSKGDAAKRRIHLYGLRDDGSFATGLREHLFDNRPYAARYEPLESYASVLKAVVADPYGIAIIGAIKSSDVPRDVRLLPVRDKAGVLQTPSRQAVAGGAYPLSSGIYFYVDKAPGKPLDPLVKSWLNAALSDEGQSIIAQQSSTEEGYLPLAPEDLRKERAVLQAM